MSALVDAAQVLDSICERAAAGDPAEYREMNAFRDVVTDLIAANKLLMDSRPAHMCPRNAKERQAYMAIESALNRAGGAA